MMKSSQLLAAKFKKINKNELFFLINRYHDERRLINQVHASANAIVTNCGNYHILAWVLGVLLVARLVVPVAPIVVMVSVIVYKFLSIYLFYFFFMWFYLFGKKFASGFQNEWERGCGRWRQSYVRTTFLTWVPTTLTFRRIAREALARLSDASSHPPSVCSGAAGAAQSEICRPASVRSAKYITIL
jgi:hypothetical protein